MSRLLGLMDLLLAVVLGLAALAALGGVPDALARRAEEPEDFYGLLLLAAIAATVSLGAGAVGWVLVRQKSVWKLSFDRAASLSAALSLVLLVVSLIELRLLLLPAALLGGSFLLLRRTHRSQQD